MTGTRTIDGDADDTAVVCAHVGCWRGSCRVRGAGAEIRKSTTLVFYVHNANQTRGDAPGSGICWVTSTRGLKLYTVVCGDDCDFVMYI